MKVIFLDIDGVLNTSELLRSFGSDHIDPALTALLSRIVRETGAEIVLSSTWRIEDKNRELVELALSRHGMRLFASTPVVKKEWPEITTRSEEISFWLRENPSVTKFAILDDWDDAEIEGNFFRTDEDHGLTFEIAERVILHLA